MRFTVTLFESLRGYWVTRKSLSIRCAGLAILSSLLLRISLRFISLCSSVNLNLCSRCFDASFRNGSFVSYIGLNIRLSLALFSSLHGFLLIRFNVGLGLSYHRSLEFCHVRWRCFPLSPGASDDFWTCFLGRPSFPSPCGPGDLCVVNRLSLSGAGRRYHVHASHSRLAILRGCRRKIGCYRSSWPINVSDSLGFRFRFLDGLLDCCLH
mmetsp:Transcript_21719/g.32325  ORF Transcript_21719/g.32325 Transcript_21719/m.32325 type:complete len:210 (+) Transcript_21719:2518-3147(+)